MFRFFKLPTFDKNHPECYVVLETKPKLAIKLIEPHKYKEIQNSKNNVEIKDVKQLNELKEYFNPQTLDTITSASEDFIQVKGLKSVSSIVYVGETEYTEVEDKSLNSEYDSFNSSFLDNPEILKALKK